MSAWRKVAVGAPALAIAACGVFGDNSDSSEEAPPAFEAGTPQPPPAPPPPPADGGAPDAADASIDVGVDAGGVKLVYVTAQKVPIPVAGTGVPGFDVYCNSISNKPRPTATFIAFVSTAAENAVARLTADEYYMVGADGGVGPLYITKATIAASGNPTTNVIRDGKGNLQTNGDPVWTGSLGNGTNVTGDTCADWMVNTTGTARTGTVGSTSNGFWLTQQSTPCNSTARLLCFEQ